MKPNARCQMKGNDNRHYSKSRQSKAHRE